MIKKIIEEFETTGLNIIDFITSGYYIRGLSGIQKAIEEIEHVDNRLRLTLDEYQASNLLALLQLLYPGADIVSKETGEKIYANNGDWFGEIRWQLEEYIKQDRPTNFGKELPDWAAQRNTFLTKKQWKERGL